MKKLAASLLLLLFCASGLLRSVQADPPPPMHLLWTKADGTAKVWTINSNGTVTSTPDYGPYSDWSAKAVMDGPDGNARILWSRSNGVGMIWTVDAAGKLLTNTPGYELYNGWSAVGMSMLSPGGTGTSGGTGLTGPAGGDLFGFYPNPTIAANAVDHTKLASDPGSLGQVSGGLLSTNDNWHVNVLNDLIVKGTVVALRGNGGGAGNNNKQGRALVDGGSANNLIINYANDFGRVSVQSELDVHGALGLEPGDIYANNDINIHRNTTVHGTFGVSGGNLGVDGAVNLGDGNINSANDININKNTTVRGIFGVTDHMVCNGWAAFAGGISSGDTVTAKSLQITGGSDLAEPYKIAAAAQVQPIPGMVVSIDPNQTGQMRVSTRAYDNTVGGIISGAGGVQPGVVLRQTGTVADGTLPIASVGRVWCWCDADAGGAITPGDLLTTSDTPGHAMRVRDHDKARGAILGKAMSPLKTGKGLVLVLVTLE